MEYLTIGKAHDGFFDGTFTCKDLVSYYLDRIRKYDGKGSSRGETERDPAQPDPEPDPVSSKSQEPDPALFERMLQLSEPEATQPPALNAILAISTTSLEEAAELDSHLAETNLLRGPLHGIPVIVKDQIETAGLITTYGSVKAKGHLPREDATVIQRLKDAGAIILAKSTMPGK
jgi:Amidase